MAADRWTLMALRLLGEPLPPPPPLPGRTHRQQIPNADNELARLERERRSAAVWRELAGEART
jgi:hypothetical protein